MTNQEINEYIYNYIKTNKTNRAIMLSGDWGSGKSYYIKKTLEPYLKKKNKKTVIISLYGISNLDDIAKEIYLQLRSINLLKTSEVTETAKIVGKTLMKTLLTVNGLNINDFTPETPDLKKLYNSLDLTNVLIIFEDLERSQVDIIKFLGYLNNFTEQGGVKALIVANEKIILSEGEKIDLRTVGEKSVDRILEGVINKDTKKKKEVEISEYAKKYMITKEKTVIDTIIYNCDYKSAIKGIIDMFDNTYLKKFKKDKELKIISNIISINENNLRSFVLACQKTRDIFEKIPTEFLDEYDFLFCIFLSNVEFFLKYNKGKFPDWNSSESVSSQYGNETYPMFKFAYDYITRQCVLNDEIIGIGKRAYEEYKKYNVNYRDNEDLNSVFNYSIQSEKSLEKTMENITIKLDEDSIPVLSYGRLAFKIMCIKQDLEMDVESIKEKLVENLSRHKGKVIGEYLFSSSDEYSDYFNEEIKMEFNILKEKMLAAIEEKIELYNIEFTDKGISDWCEVINNNHDRILEERKFLRCFDIEQFVLALGSCSSKVLSNVREMFENLYNKSICIKSFFPEDVLALEDFIKKLAELKIELSKKSHDKICIFQLKKLEEVLSVYYERIKN